MCSLRRPRCWTSSFSPPCRWCDHHARLDRAGRHTAVRAHADWHEACFIPDLTDAEAAWAVARRFFALRDDDLVGGLVLRRFEPLTGAEVRTWWIDGECRLVGAHPDTPDELPADAGIPVRCLPAGLAEAVRGLRLPFVTVDLARRADGAWRVVELGDGQVRDRPAPLMPEHLIAAL